MEPNLSTSIDNLVPDVHSLAWLFRCRVPDVDLEAVLAGIAGSGDQYWDIVDLSLRGGVSFDVLQVCSRYCSEDVASSRSLDSEHCNCLAYVLELDIVMIVIFQEPVPILLSVRRVVNDEVSACSPSEYCKGVYYSSSPVSDAWRFSLAYLKA